MIDYIQSAAILLTALATILHGLAIKRMKGPKP